MSASEMLTCKQCGRLLRVIYQPWNWPVGLRKKTATTVTCPECFTVNAIDLPGTFQAVLVEEKTE